MRGLVSWVIVLVVIAACSNEGVPRATPTVAPTDTPTNTAANTEIALQPTRTAIFTPTQVPTDLPTTTATPLPTDTPTESPTPSNTPSDTPTSTPSNTPDPSETPTLTPTPSDTPTDTPTNTATPTPSRTPTPTRTPTHTPTNTPNPSETPTLTPSRTPTRTPTNTPIPTRTATFTPSPSPTNTQIPSPTPLPLPLPTRTPSNTPTPTRTSTPLPTDRPTSTPLPTRTPLPPTPDSTRIAQALTATSIAFGQTLTARAPSPTPTNTVPMTPTTPPTQDVPPTFITAEPQTPLPDDLGLITPLPPDTAEPQEEQFELTPTPVQVQPTVELIVPIPPTVSADELPSLPPLTNISSLVYGISTIGGQLTQGAFSLGVDNLNLFARNPVNPGQYVMTNSAGTFFMVNDGVPFRPVTSPWSEFEPRTAEENQYFVEALRYSPNGQWVALIIDGVNRHPDPTAADGVHLFNTSSGAAHQILTDAPGGWHPGANLGGARDFFSVTDTLEWSPGSSRLLTRGHITDDNAIGENLGVLSVMDVSQDPRSRPAQRRCDYGTWSWDGSRIIVSGRCGDANGDGVSGDVIIGSLDAGLGDYQVIFHAYQQGLWVQNAVQRPDGSIVALGSQGGRLSPMRIIDSSGNFLTDNIGSGPPQRVEWSPDRSAVLVVAGGRQYVARINGQVVDITGSVGGLNAISWLSGGLPSNTRPSVDGPTSQGNVPAPGEIPSGVLEGSIYSAGQQLQVVSTTLNLRDQPDLSSTVIGSLVQGDYVVILAGPASIDGFFWWSVQTANRQVGWIAGEINGFSTLR